VSQNVQLTWLLGARNKSPVTIELQLMKMKLLKDEVSQKTTVSIFICWNNTAGSFIALMILGVWFGYLNFPGGFSVEKIQQQIWLVVVYRQIFGNKFGYCQNHLLVFKIWNITMKLIWLEVQGDGWANVDENFFMATLRSRCGHYICAMWFLLSSIFFFLA